MPHQFRFYVQSFGKALCFRFPGLRASEFGIWVQRLRLAFGFRFSGFRASVFGSQFSVLAFPNIGHVCHAVEFRVSRFFFQLAFFTVSGCRVPGLRVLYEVQLKRALPRIPRFQISDFGIQR